MLRRNALLLTATALPTRMKNKLSTGQRVIDHVLTPDCTLFKNFNNNNSGQMMMMTMRSRVGVLSTTPASTSENELLLLDHHNGHDHHDYNDLGKRDWDKPSTLFKRYSWSSYPTQRYMYFIVPTLKEEEGEEGVAQQLCCWERAGVAKLQQPRHSSCCLPSSEVGVVMTSTVWTHPCFIPMRPLWG